MLIVIIILRSCHGQQSLTNPEKWLHWGPCIDLPDMYEEACFLGIEIRQVTVKARVLHCIGVALGDRSGPLLGLLLIVSGDMGSAQKMGGSSRF